MMMAAPENRASQALSHALVLQLNQAQERKDTLKQLCLSQGEAGTLLKRYHDHFVQYLLGTHAAAMTLHSQLVSYREQSKKTGKIKEFIHLAADAARTLAFLPGVSALISTVQRHTLESVDAKEYKQVLKDIAQLLKLGVTHSDAQEAVSRIALTMIERTKDAFMTIIAFGTPSSDKQKIDIAEALAIEKATCVIDAITSLRAPLEHVDASASQAVATVVLATCFPERQVDNPLLAAASQYRPG